MEIMAMNVIHRNPSTISTAIRNLLLSVFFDSPTGNGIYITSVVLSNVASWRTEKKRGIEVRLERAVSAD